MASVQLAVKYEAQLYVQNILGIVRNARKVMNLAPHGCSTPGKIYFTWSIMQVQNSWIEYFAITKVFHLETIILPLRKKEIQLCFVKYI